MALNSDYLDAIAAANPITHIGLLDDTQTELSSASYARQAASWTSPTDGDVQLTADLEFDVADGDEVHYWQGYDDASAGTAYGPVALDTPVTFSNDGTFTLVAAQTSINHNAA